MKGFTVWLTGLSGSGKTTIARGLAGEIGKRGQKAIVIDGEEMRNYLDDSLGFSPSERLAQARRLSFIAGLLARNGIVAVAAAVSPSREAREAARKELGDFVEVYVKCDPATCAAREGVEHTAWTDTSYDVPESPEVVCDTSELDPEESVQKVIKKLEMLGFLPVAEVEDGYSEDEEKKVEDRLRSLGYIE
jgi:adenylylsulfate kinase-like enzyme